MTKEQKQLLRKIKKHIMEEPKRFMMGWWIHKKEELKDFPHMLDRDLHDKPIVFPKCNTTACIAGWAVLLHDGMEARNLSDIEIHHRAVEILGPKVSAELFGQYNWPENLCTAFDDAKTKRGKAKIACKAIDYALRNL